MIIKYALTKYSNKIEKKEFTRETNSMVFYLSSDGTERREHKTSEFVSYFDTFEQARTAAIKEACKKITYLNKQIADLDNDLAELRKLNAPD